ncbi:MAG: hypothetical protein U1C51_02800, partial [Candidatus Izemoplasmatales bacterium]|nr:hypothetical protein [Candidatus Izemoplasmatales bacterium]
MRFRLHLSAVVFALYFLVIPCDYHCNETSFSNVVGAELTDVEGPLVDDSIPTKADELDVHSSSDQPRVLDINITDVNPKLLKNNDDWWKMLAASMVSFLCSFLIFRLSMKKSNLDGLRAQLADVLKIAVQYPQLESEGFTSKWSQIKDTDNEHYIRYDNYCNLVFNL